MRICGQPPKVQVAIADGLATSAVSVVSGPLMAAKGARDSALIPACPPCYSRGRHIPGMRTLALLFAVAVIGLKAHEPRITAGEDRLLTFGTTFPIVGRHLTVNPRAPT